MFPAVVSVIVMVLSGIVGLFAGAFLDNAVGGAILFALIAGIACIIYAINSKDGESNP